MLAASFLALLAAGEVDPITAILTRNWASLGGWSLLMGTWIIILIGAMKEWWVPGARYKRLEESATRQSETLATTVKTLDRQVTAGEITKHFFEEVGPKGKTSPRREMISDEEST